MADPQLQIPYLNPVRFYDMNPIELPQYLNKLFLNYSFDQTLKEWEQEVNYFQPWQTTDIIRLQITSNYDPIQIDLINKDGISVLTTSLTAGLPNKFVPGFYLYECQISLASVPVGKYYFKLTAGGGIVNMISDPICVKVKHPNTLLFEYSNSQYSGDVIFETGIVFSFRLPGVIKRVGHINQKTKYNDQKLNPTLLRAVTGRKYPVTIGGYFGVPDWVEDIHNMIWTMDDVNIDGDPYALVSDDFAMGEEEFYPMRFISYDIQEGINRGSKLVNPDADTRKKITVVYSIESDVFGDVAAGAGSSNVINILSKE